MEVLLVFEVGGCHCEERSSVAIQWL
jgi:hypothetical protein